VKFSPRVKPNLEITNGKIYLFSKNKGSATNPQLR